MAKIKHITMTCPQKGCTNQAFVQVVIVDEVAFQPAIDTKARKKLRSALTKAHKEGAHDELW